VRELSFSDQPMTATQIARAIDHNPERTETALARMEKDGQVFRNEEGRWTIGLSALSHLKGHATAPSNGELQTSAEC
jgi:DNA-binding IclR family transcriptional regulator